MAFNWRVLGGSRNSSVGLAITNTAQPTKNVTTDAITRQVMAHIICKPHSVSFSSIRRKVCSTCSTLLPPPWAISGLPPPRPSSIAHASRINTLMSPRASAERANTRRAVSLSREASNAIVPGAEIRANASFYNDSASRPSNTRLITPSRAVASNLSASTPAATSSSSRMRRCSSLFSSTKCAAS